MTKTNIVILLLLILFVFYICENKEHFVYMNKIYNTCGNCNDYIPNYNSCNLTPSLDNENIENFTCPCSKRYKNY
jgi:hypothetical protein